MPRKPTAPRAPLAVADLTHAQARRSNIPTAEYEPMLAEAQKAPIRLAYERRNADLDPQLIWRGKGAPQEESADTLIVQAPPLYIQEKVRPKALIDNLLAQSRTARPAADAAAQPSLFADFNGVPEGVDKTEFYQHEQNWTNRMILGDSLRVMASLAEREGLRGQVQCIYLDPPYGIKFNSNFQWSTTSRDVKDGNAAHITREPEQVRAFRDTWRDGIHSYLSYLRDRLLVARDLLAESGSIFVQIGDENVHRVRCLMDEVFGEENFVSQIVVEKTSSSSTEGLASINDYILWFTKSVTTMKFRPTYRMKLLGESGTTQYVWFDEGCGSDHRLSTDELKHIDISKVFACDNLTSQRPAQGADVTMFRYNGKNFTPGKGTFKTDATGLLHLARSGRLRPIGNSLMYKRLLSDFPVVPIVNYWNDTKMTGFSEDKIYVVQTGQKIIQRCILMTTDPGDLVLDPTCGSGTTAYVAEQWGRRWITVDTSRVALALARARLMGARYPWYLLADSPEGAQKEAEISQTPFTPKEYYGGAVRQGFVYERVPHITLKSIANNEAIDGIWDKWQKTLEPLRETLNAALKKHWEEWEIPRTADDGWPPAAAKAHADWWEARIARQDEIDACIAARADYEYLYDKPYEDKKRVRVAGPFTVESLSPHHTLAVDERGDPFDPDAADRRDFASMILEDLRTAGVQQAHKEGRISFDSLVPWPGELVCADGRYHEGGEGGAGAEKRAAICIGPEFGTVGRADLVAAAREAADAGFDVLIVCAFNYEAAASGFDKLGSLPVLRARMNADLHMSTDLKGAGNLFVIFGEPDIELQQAPEAGADCLRVKLRGVDVFHPASGEVRSDNADGIACWFIDTDYNEESFFVRHAYFLGAGDPYKALKTTLKAEIDADAWESLHSDTSRPFAKPANGRIAVKVINHLGDEVMKVFKV